VTQGDRQEGKRFGTSGLGASQPIRELIRLFSSNSSHPFIALFRPDANQALAQALSRVDNLERYR
jgi:hypothetical protein